MYDKFAFAGTAPGTTDVDAILPRWDRSYAGEDQGNRNNYPTLHGAVKRLNDEYHATRRKVAYYDEDAGEWVEAAGNKAIIHQQREGDTEAVWNMATDSYTPVNAGEMYNPLVAAITSNFDLEEIGPVFGHARLFDNGGEVHIDVYFDGIRVADEDKGGKPYVLGMQTGYSHRGNRTLYAEPIGMNRDTGAVMRGLYDERSRRHQGKATDQTGDWWTAAIGELDHIQDTLYQVIADARNWRVTFAEYPFDNEEYYQKLGFPGAAGHGVVGNALEYLQCPADAESRTEYRAWDLYHAVTQALTKDYEGKDTGALKDHVKRANYILHRPDGALADVLEAKEKEMRGQQSLSENDEDVVDRLRQQRDTIEDNMRQYATTKERLRTYLKEQDGNEVQA